MSILIEELADLLFEAQVRPEDYNAILDLAKQLEDEKKAEREANKAPKSKNQLISVIKLSRETPHEDIHDDNVVSHVFQIPEEFDPNELIPSIVAAATEHNLACKRRKNLVTNFDDIPHIKRKFLKEKNILLKTKEDWARVIVLPEDIKFGGYEEYEE
jgi:hypothetical protein